MKLACVAIDLVNPDKPAASLAFLAGVCEKVGADYQVLSINEKLLRSLDRRDYDTVYNLLKLGKRKEISKRIDAILEQAAQDLKLFQPEICLVSLFSYMQMPLAEIWLSKLKRHLPDCVIVAGGPGVQSSGLSGQSNGRILLEQHLVDYYVLGEGDRILIDFLDGRRDMLGLNSNEYKSESWVPQISDLDRDYVLPSYRKIDLSVYQNMEGKSRPVLTLSTSRGCVRRCSFCDVESIWPKFRFRDGSKVANEVLKLAQETGSPHFHITDSLINGSLKSFREFNLAMIDLKQSHAELADFSYNGMFIVRDKRSHDYEFFAQMADAGCESLQIGVETGSDRLRFEMNKKFTNRDLDHHLEMCQQVGIKNTLLMFTGYPTETDEDFQQTLQMLERYQHFLIDGTIIGINFSGIFSMLPHTPVWDQRHDIGIDIDESGPDKRLVWNNRNNPDLTIKRRIMRDLRFRQRAAELRYPIPYSDRYLQYLQHIDADFVPVSD